MRRCLVCIALLSLLSACGSNNQKSPSLSRVESSLADLRSFQAEQTTELDSVSQRLSSLSGRLEELEFKLSRAYPSQFSANQPQVNQPANYYGQAPAQPNSDFASANPPGNTVAGTFRSEQPSANPGARFPTNSNPEDSIRGSFQKLNPPASNPAPIQHGTSPIYTEPLPAPPSVVPVPALRADEAFVTSLPQVFSEPLSASLAQLREGRFQDSLITLQRLIQNSDQRVKPLAQFWLGVTYDGLGENRNALGAYNDLIVQFSRHPRAPHALLRQSDVLVRLGDRASAKLVLQKLIQDFPNTEEAKIAQGRIKKYS